MTKNNVILEQLAAGVGFLHNAANNIFGIGNMGCGWLWVSWLWVYLGSELHLSAVFGEPRNVSTFLGISVRSCQSRSSAAASSQYSQSTSSSFYFLSLAILNMWTYTKTILRRHWKVLVKKKFLIGAVFNFSIEAMKSCRRIETFLLRKQMFCK